MACPPLVNPSVPDLPSWPGSEPASSAGEAPAGLRVVLRKACAGPGISQEMAECGRARPPAPKSATVGVGGSKTLGNRLARLKKNLSL